jgi:hypothetical protein
MKENGTKEVMVTSKESYLSVAQVKDHVTLVNNILKEVLVEGVVENGKIVKDGHYSKLPGCGERLVLLKPGAEKLCLAFNLIPKYSINILSVSPSELVPPGHRDYDVTCELFSRSTGCFAGQGLGSCTTLETKYKSRNENRICPKCRKETIFKSKHDGGWYCWAKQGGCGAKFKPGDQSIEAQPVGKIPNPDIADTYNTVKKMACKRALIHAVIQCLAVGDIFMQDVEDMKPSDLDNTPPQTQQKKQKAAPPRSKSENKATPAQVKAIQTMLSKTFDNLPDNVLHANAARMLGLKEIKSFKDLSFEQASELIKMLGEEV